MTQADMVRIKRMQLLGGASQAAYKKATRRSHISIPSKIAFYVCAREYEGYRGPMDFWSVYLFFLARLLEFDGNVKMVANKMRCSCAPA